MKLGLKEIGRQVKKAIAKGRSSDAVETLNKYFEGNTEDTRLEKRATLFSNRYFSIRRKRMYDGSSANQELHLLNQELLEFVDDLNAVEETGKTKGEQEISNLRRRLFLAKSVSDLEKINFEAGGLTEQNPKNFSARKLFNDSKRALEIENKLKSSSINASKDIHIGKRASTRNSNNTINIVIGRWFWIVLLILMLYFVWSYLLI